MNKRNQRKLMKKTLAIIMAVFVLGIFFVTAGMKTAYAGTVSKYYMLLPIGEQQDLSVSLGSKYKWSTSSKRIAPITSAGVVKGKRAGTANITARKGKSKIVIQVTVVKDKKAKNVKHKYRKMTVRKGRKPVYTGDPEVDYIAEDIIRAAGIKATMSDKKIVKRIYKYMSKNFSYYYEIAPKLYYPSEEISSQVDAFQKKTDKAFNKKKIRYNSSHLLYDSIYFLQRRTGVCDDHAAIFAILCEHVGIKAGTVGGNLPSGAGHKWAWVKIGGKTRYYDIGLSIHSYTANHKVNYKYYALSKKKMKKRGYRFDITYKTNVK